MQTCRVCFVPLCVEHFATILFQPSSSSALRSIRRTLSSFVRWRTSSGVNQATSCDSSLTRISSSEWAISRKRTSWCSCASSMMLAVRIVAGGNFVYVDVQRHDDAVDRHDVELGHARFLAGFAEGDFFDVPLAVGMSA